MSSIMQPPFSIYDAIKADDYEGLLSLYATAVYDAVHSAEFADNIYDGETTDMDLSSILMPTLQRDMIAGRPPRDVALFVDEKKNETAQLLLGTASTKTTLSIQELDNIVCEIIGPELFDSHQQRFTTILKSDDEMVEDPPKRSSRQPFKKIRQYSPSPSRKIPQLSPRDGLIHQNHSSSSDKGKSESAMETHIEKIMWDSAAVLSNSHPTPNFSVDRSKRLYRENMLNASHNRVSFGSEPVETGVNIGQGVAEGNITNQSLPLSQLFEGNIANATPGNLHDGGTGSGTAQHLACLLDSPLALAILITMGINVDSRHTAFRRLSMHEAACADSPKCLHLLMDAATKFKIETESTLGKGQIDGSVGTGTSDSFGTASATVFDSMVQDILSCPNSMVDSPRSYKMKIPFFLGWGEKKTLQKSIKDDEKETCGDHITFPEALKIIWDVIKMVRSGDLTEEVAAHDILNRVGVPSRTKRALALQLGVNSESETTSTKHGSILYMYGLNRNPLRQRVTNNIDGHGNTPLHWAAFKNSVRAIDILLSYNVDVNFPAQPSGWTPLHDAAYSDSAGAVKRLIAAGACVNARSHSGATPLCFAAQEDAFNATKLLLDAGADPAIRCLGSSPGTRARENNADNNVFHSRFSGYTPLHYCAHYNSSKSTRILLNHQSNQFGSQLSGDTLLEIPDLNEKLPIHIAVARGSSEVLRELLHGGARVETASYHPPLSPRVRRAVAQVTSPSGAVSITLPTILAANREMTSSNVITPVSSPVLRSLLPSQPINSSKPWNCLSQKSIDACKSLIEEVEQNWTPSRHALFSPTDRIAVKEVLRVGKRLEQNGSGIILEMWPYVLSFCGRGWFEVHEDEPESDTHMSGVDRSLIGEEALQCLSSDDISDDGAEYTQFELDETPSTANMVVL